MKLGFGFILLMLIEVAAFIATFHSSDLNQLGWHIFFGCAILLFLFMAVICFWSDE